MICCVKINLAVTLRSLVLITQALLLTSCGWFMSADQEKSKSYINVVAQKPLEIPEGLSADRIRDPFPVPQVAEQVNPDFYPKRPPLPDALYANDNRKEVRIQKLGGRRWLALPESPTTAWPKIKQFFADNGVDLLFEDTDSGRLETEDLRITQDNYRDVVRSILAEESVSPDGLHKIILEVQSGLQTNSSEIRLRHFYLTQDTAGKSSGRTSMGNPSDSVQVEEKLLSDLGSYVAARVAELTVSRVALTIGGSAKTNIRRDAQGRPVLQMSLDKDRAWATLGQAVRNAGLAGITSVSEDPADREIVIRVPRGLLISENGRGFFCRITFSCGNKSDFKYVLKMKGMADKADIQEVFVSRVNEMPITNELSQQILVLIKEYAA